MSSEMMNKEIENILEAKTEQVEAPEVFDSIMQRFEERKRRSQPVPLRTILTVAASLLLLVALNARMWTQENQPTVQQTTSSTTSKTTTVEEEYFSYTSYNF